jgi:hypothetical protein
MLVPLLSFILALISKADADVSWYIVSCDTTCQRDEYKSECYVGSTMGMCAVSFGKIRHVDLWPVFAGKCNECGFNCLVAQYAFGCGGKSPGVCKDCTLCEIGYYSAGCGGVQPGVCTACTKCKDNKYIVACGHNSPGTCESSPESESGGSDDTFPYHALAGPFFFLFVLSLIGCCCKNKRTHSQNARAVAIAMHEEKLPSEDLACVRLMKLEPRLVQVRGKMRVR